MTRLVKNIPYPHTSIGPFFTALKTYMNDYVAEFQTNIIGTYDKAIQLIEQRRAEQLVDPLDPSLVYRTERYQPEEPILLLTPSLSEPVPQADLPGRYHNWAPITATWFKRPFVLSNGTKFIVETRRMAGTVDIRMFTESLMGAHDIQMNVLNAFRGLGKWMPLPRLTQFLVLRDNIRLATEDGTQIVTWGEDLAERLIPSFNQEEYYLSLPCQPLIMLQSIADASSFFGGNGFPSYALQASVAYEIEIPSMYIVTTKEDILDLEIDMYMDYISVGQQTPIPLDHRGYIALQITEADDLNTVIGKIITVEDIAVPFVDPLPEPWAVEITFQTNLNDGKVIIYCNGFPVKADNYSKTSDYTLAIVLPRITEGEVTVSAIKYESL